VKKLKAEIEITYEDPRAAKSIAAAVSPDNLNPPKGLSVETEAVGSSVRSSITCDKKIETFISTIDDLLSAIQSAERTLARIHL
jgi:hypothetical protein